MSSTLPSLQNPPPTDAPRLNANPEKPLDNEGAGEPQKAKKPSFKQRAAKLWSKTMLDLPTMKMMAK
jgi:hypothetical protein